MGQAVLDPDPFAQGGPTVHGGGQHLEALPDVKRQQKLTRWRH
jgi:hypothetical protein